MSPLVPPVLGGLFIYAVAGHVKNCTAGQSGNLDNSSKSSAIFNASERRDRVSKMFRVA
jgi:hypothetical protein